MSLTLERISLSDRDEIEVLCGGIWDGMDYLPKVFDDWVSDGGFYKGIENGRIIAVDKYTRLENGVLWLEGLRVHPEYQGMGYGKEMVRKFLSLIESKESFSKLRFMTSASNEKMVPMAREFGFEVYLETHSFMISREEGLSEENVGGLIVETDWERVYRNLLITDEFRDNRGLYLNNWTAHDITPDLIKKEVKAGACISEPSTGATGFFKPYLPYNTLCIPFIAGDVEGIRRLIPHGIHSMFREGWDRLSVKTASQSVKTIVEEYLVQGDKKIALVFQR